MRPQQHKKKFKLPEFVDLRALLLICWRQGLKRNTRWQFWQQLFSIIRYNPGVFKGYLTNCAYLEHFIDYRQIVRDEIEIQLAKDTSLKSRNAELATYIS